MRSIRDYIVISLKGVAMGVADVIPGVSGGTIAFISGIYEELINTISCINFAALQTLFKKGIGPFWKQINGNFLVALLSGIFLSILTLAALITGLLKSEPIAVWSFFFGLVLASIPLVAQKVKTWDGLRIFAFVAGAIIAYLITELPPVSNPDAQWYIFISGMIAICAMILPGISGSFILLLMGSYLTVLGAISDRDIITLFIFAAGCIIGLLSFSHLLKWMFDRYHDITIALLSGFLLGSLNKIWPWKNVLETFTKHAGEVDEEIVPLVEENVWPQMYTELTGLPAQLGLAIALALAGIAIIFALDRLAATKKKV